MKTTYLCGSPWLPDAVPVLGRDHNLALHGETGEPWGGEGPGNGHRVHSVDPPVPRVRDDHLQAEGPHPVGQEQMQGAGTGAGAGAGLGAGAEAGAGAGHL